MFEKTHAFVDKTVHGRFLGGVIVFGLLFVILASGSAYGQKKYSPNDEVVEEIVRKGLAFLEKNAQSNHGEAALAALTVVEAGKRYDREVPKEHPLVKLAVETILSDLHNEGPGSVGFDTYYNCLAIILLLEVNDREYRADIEKLCEKLFEKMNPAGGFSYSSSTATDTSQTQYAALAFTVLKLHGYKVFVDEAKMALNFFCNVQTQAGSWYYHTTPNGGAADGLSNQTLSLHMAGAGTIYMIQDLLNLSPRAKKQAAGGGTQKFDTLLPPSVTLFVKRESADGDPDAPLTDFDKAKLDQTKRAANQWFGTNFRIQIPEWNYYYLYGLERYAYFRTLAEGRMGDVPDWYDQGVDFIKSNQAENGSWPPLGPSPENTNNSTCLAMLFLVRSSEILMVDPSLMTVSGNKGFGDGKLENRGGEVVSDATVQGVEDVMTALRNASSADDLDVLMPAIKMAVADFSAKGEKSTAQQKSFLVGLVTDEEWFRRKIGVKFLAASQDLDNVPALLYALTDPVKEIREEAHNGLRLISRKIDAFPLSEEASLGECTVLKQKWTEWYLGLRPDAKLLD